MMMPMDQMPQQGHLLPSILLLAIVLAGIGAFLWLGARLRDDLARRGGPRDWVVRLAALGLLLVVGAAHLGACNMLMGDGSYSGHMAQHPCCMARTGAVAVAQVSRPASPVTRTEIPQPAEGHYFAYQFSPDNKSPPLGV